MTNAAYSEVSESRLQTEDFGRVLDRQKREPPSLVRDVQYPDLCDPELVAHADHSRRCTAVGPDDELLDDVRIRELQCFEERAALQR